MRSRKNRPNRWLFLFVFLALPGVASLQAALINADETMFRGGGCVGLIKHGQGQASCDNVTLSVSDTLISIQKDFSQTDEHEEGEDEGGMGGPPEGSGHDGEEPHEELYSRLSPIQTMFETTNDGGMGLYTVDEWITNSTGQPWLGFLFRLRGEGAEADLVEFVLSGPAPMGSFFPDLEAGRKKLQWTGASLADGDSFHVQFQVALSDSPDSAGYRFLLQEFPLIPGSGSASIPEPASVGLLALGLGVLGVLRGRKRSLSR